MTPIIIVFIISIVISLFISLPLIRKSFSDENREKDINILNPEYLRLVNEKDSVLNEIKDIDLDFGLGKLNETDYTELRKKYRYKAAELIKKIEEYEKESL